MTIHNAQLELESGCKIFAQHICAENELPQLLRVLDTEPEDKSEQRHWALFSVWLATAEDVAVGDATELDELLNLSSVKIQFCPFCGEKLPEVSDY